MPDKNLEAAIEAGIKQVREATGAEPNFVLTRDCDAARWEGAAAEISRREKADPPKNHSCECECFDCDDAAYAAYRKAREACDDV